MGAEVAGQVAEAAPMVTAVLTAGLAALARQSGGLWVRRRAKPLVASGAFGNILTMSIIAMPSRKSCIIAFFAVK